ncbi:hypothetical protein H4CHR_05638 [Variovorax sp. PBS-H4]|uniref:hypothetical protein n=1 Tax=Variovorax sp. PBS-H4 TaxID=434008 RepID=UPI00131974A7|nr:hypothetical protein [Variovorax sp. PBS-H4]VTU40905.1 hypothetical protein H4CHR_05638 [Variovorax sp. PBS-H4]
MTKAACGDKWEKVLTCLKKVEGLSTEDDRIVALSMIGEQDVDRMAEAIGILVYADCLVAACTLLRLCEPAVRFNLLKLCGGECVDRWRRCDDPQVRNPLNRALDAAAHKALRDGNLRQLFGLLRWCPVETRTSVAAVFPALTLELVDGLDGDDFVEAVRLTVERALTQDAGKCLAELHLLLSFADLLKTTHGPWALTIMAVACPAMDELPPGTDDAGLAEFATKLREMARLPELTRDLVGGLPASMRTEVLCVAAEQALTQSSPEACVTRLLGLAELSDKIDERDGLALRSHMMVVVGWQAVRCSGPAYQAYKTCLEAMLSRGSVAKSRLSISVKTKTGYAIAKSAKALIGLADAFRGAIESGDLFKAALAIRACPHPEFCDTALRDLVQRVSERLTAAAEAGDVVEVQMARVLLATGDAQCARSGARLVATRFRTAAFQQWAIEQILESGESTPNPSGSLLARMVDALPGFCSEEPHVGLDILLMIEDGRKLVAQAVVRGLASGVWSSPKIRALFNGLADRIDLGAALLAVQGLVQFSHDGKGRIARVLDPSARTPLGQIERWRKFFVPFEPVRDPQSWARGWRALWAMLDRDADLPTGPMVLLAMNAIDAAAADGLRGGADELLHRLPFPWAQEGLDVMLRLKVNDQLLLSGSDLHKVLRAMLSDKQLGRDTLVWMGQVEDPVRRVELHAAAAHALISLADDLSPCRFDPERRANHVVGDMVHLFELQVMRFLKIGKDIEASMGQEAWLQISSKFPRSRT